MQFNSYIFILAFLPIVITGYFLLNKCSEHMGKCFIVLSGFVFYAFSGWKTTVVLVISLLINLLFSIAVIKIKRKRLILSLCILANVACLFYYKYIDFVLVNLGRSSADNTAKKIIIPLGISFFTFQQIMYVVNVYRCGIQKVVVLDYLTYILYFPKLVMGPLVEPVDIINQFNDSARKRIDANNILCGLKLFSYGLFKKMIIADTMAKAVSWGFADVSRMTAFDSILVMLAYSFEIYFDFSGYCDMATGISKMLNIDLPINFDSPYKALSIRDFWKRWHISLTGFLTKYVYIPLGGSKKGKIRTYINTLIVFLVSGIWHGANWTFILWGLLHGILSVGERIFEKYETKFMETVRWMVTFAMINVLWLLFRADSIGQWIEILGNIIRFQFTNIQDGLIECFVLPETDFLLRFLHLTKFDVAIRGFSMMVFFGLSFVICLVSENNYKNQNKINIVTTIVAAVLFVWGFLCIGSEAVFIYSNF